MEEREDETAVEEIDLDPEMTPQEKRKKRIFYIKWGLFFGILVVLMIVCLAVIYSL